jgi:hypothetical protein
MKKNKTETFVGGESLRGHEPSQSTGVLSRASLLGFNVLRTQTVLESKIDGYNKFISF